MSAQDAADEAEDDGPGRREVAHRVFAAEYDDATLSYQEGEEERAPTYVITPSGAKANRLFLVGVLTEVEPVNDQMLRARIVDPTGAFVVYAGQYQPDARAVFDRTDPPAFLAVTGKARTFQPEDGDRVFSSVRPESVNVVDADVRDRWTVETARATLARVGRMADALRGDGPEDGIGLALEHYGTTPGYLAGLRDLSTDAAAVVAGDRDEVRPLERAPDDDHPADLDALARLADLADDAAGTGEADSGVDAAGSATETTVTDPDQEAAELAEEAASPSAAGSGSGSTDADTKATDTDETETASATADAAGGPDDGDDGATADEPDEIEEIDAGGEVEPMDTATDAGTGPDDGVEIGGEVGTETESVGDFEGGLSSGEDDDDEDDGDIGDFEPGDIGAGDPDDEEGDAAADADADADVDVGDEMYEMDDEERERIESEYGTEFSTGTEVEEPGEADIDTPESADTEPASDGDDPAADPEVDESEPADGEDDDDETEPEVEDDPDETVAETTDEAEDADIDEVLIERMRELDDGDGADRDELVAAVSDVTGADADAVTDAIQDALMSGQCYEPGEDRLKPI